MSIGCIVDLLHRVCARRLAGRLGARLLALVLATAIAGCGTAGGNAVLGPNPGGGFYCPHNAFIGCAYP